MPSARVPAPAAKATVLAMTVLTLTSLAPAVAGDSDRLEVTPGTVRPGALITVNTTACGTRGHGTGDASALGGPAAFELKPGARENVVAGQFAVPRNALPGTYGLATQCDNGKEATGNVVITEADAPLPATAQEKAPSVPGTAQARHPEGGMNTGTSARSKEPGTTHLVTGAALMAMAVVGTVWLVRRHGTGSRP